MKRVGIILVTGAIVLAMWLGAKLGFGLPGLGGGSGPGGPAAPKTGTTSTQGEAKEKSSHPFLVDGVLLVRIDGNRIVAGGRDATVEEIARAAVEHQAKVLIERTADARVKPREELERTLREKNIHVVVK